jgi:hypothetical protein
MEIECGGSLQFSENYKKLSDEYLNCYTNHIKGIENENDCTKNEIPEGEGSKCCFVETSKIINNGSIINDKRCFILQNKYFTKEKNFSNYLLDESGVDNLDEIKNANITINCKNYEPFFFQGAYDDSKIKNPLNPSTDVTSFNDTLPQISPINKKEKSGLKGGIIAVIVICCCVFFVGIIITIYLIYNKVKRNKKEGTEQNKTNITQNDFSQSNDSKTKYVENNVSKGGQYN